MMIYLQRQRKSVISDIGFKSPAGILLVLCLLFTALRSGNDVNSTGYGSGAAERQMLLAVSSVVENDLYLHRDAGQGRAKLLADGISRQFVRFMTKRMNRIAAVMLPAVLPELFKQYWSLGCKERKEILPWSMRLVEYMRDADGKKNGLAASIK